MSELITVATNGTTPVYPSVDAVKLHYQQMTQCVRELMVKEIDYGTIPGTSKPTLLKPGAEKILSVVQPQTRYELIKSIEDFEQPLFYYHYRCSLFHDGELMGSGDGNANTKERRYERQQNRICDLTNTVCKIAQKRALIAAVLNVCGASEFFTQDLEDLEEGLSGRRVVLPEIPIESNQSKPFSKSPQKGEISREEWLARQASK